MGTELKINGNSVEVILPSGNNIGKTIELSVSEKQIQFDTNPTIEYR